jgi:hypothetical protein
MLVAVAVVTISVLGGFLLAAHHLTLEAVFLAAIMAGAVAGGMHQRRHAG